MKNRVTVLAGAACALSLVLAGCGGSGDEESHGSMTGPSAGSPPEMSHGSMAEPSRTVEVEMRDIAYEPSAVEVKAGETVKFVFRNTGAILHDAFIGTEADQAEHEKEMRENAGMHHGDEMHAVTVDPGGTATLVHTFEPGESLFIGCHQPGHYQAGMKLALTVA